MNARAPTPETDAPMRVERCPACGARYNVLRLPPGARFLCRRCGATVFVTGAEPVPQPPRRTGLVVAGALLLGAAALRLPGALAPLDLDAAALALAGALSWVAAVRPAAAWLGAAAAVLLPAALRALGGSSWAAPGPDLSVPLLPLSALLGGALALSGPAASRRAGRALVAAGVAGGAVALAATAGSAGGSVLSDRAAAVAAWWAGVWRSDPAATQPAAWAAEIPWLLLALAGALATLAVACPGRRLASLARGLARAALTVGVVALLMPAGSRAWERRDAWTSPDGWAVLRDAVEGALVGNGLALAAGAAVLLAHAARGWAPPGRRLPGLASGGAWFAAACVATAVAASLASWAKPSLLAAWPWAWHDAGTPAAATVLALAFAALAAAALAVAPPLRRGPLPLIAAAVALAVPAHGVLRHGVPGDALALALCVASGALVARRGDPGALLPRGLAAVAAVAVLLVLAAPGDASGLPAGDAGPWTSTATRWAAMAGEAVATGQWEAVLSPAALGTGLLLLAGVVALAAAVVGAARPLAWLALAAVAAVILHEPAHATLGSLSAPVGAQAPLAAAGSALAAALGRTALAGLLAATIVAAEAVGPGAGSRPQGPRPGYPSPGSDR